MRENEPFTARHPVWFKISAYGGLLYLLTLMLLFLGSFAFSGISPQSAADPRTYTFGLAIVALPLAFVAYLIARHIVWPKTDRAAVALGVGWAVVQLVLNFLVALANGNLSLIFTSPGTYLVYLAVFSGALASRLHRD